MKEITRIVTYTLLFSAVVFSCEKSNWLEDQSACQLTEPIDELEWLQDLITATSESACNESIHRYDFRGGTVFVFRCGVESFCLCEAPKVLDCEGSLLFSLTGSRGEPSETEFLEEATNESLIWKND